MTVRMLRRKKAELIASMVLWVVSAGVAHAWDGVATGAVSAVQVTSGHNFGFRVFLNGVTNMCGGAHEWAYLNETDSNYKTYVAVILSAKSQGTPVTVYSTLENGYCHIGYITTQ